MNDTTNQSLHHQCGQGKLAESLYYNSSILHILWFFVPSTTQTCFLSIFKKFSSSKFGGNNEKYGMSQFKCPIFLALSCALTLEM